MTYEESLKKFPELGEYNANELESIYVSLSDDEDPLYVEALSVVMIHMNESLSEWKQFVNE